MKSLYINAYVDYNDTKCYGSLGGLVAVWDFGQKT
jgi:hypothetical protein